MTKITAAVLVLLSAVLANPVSAAHSRMLHFEITTGVPHQDAHFVSELTDWDASYMKMQETSPGTYALDLEEPWLPALHYKFVIDGQWMSDPSNPDREPDGYGGANSVIVTEFHEDPMLRPQPGVPAWDRTVLKLHDWTGAERQVTVLSPPAEVPTEGRRHIIAYFQDGGDYLNQTGVANLVANLSMDPQNPKMPLITAAFVPPRDRDNEYGVGTPEAEEYVEFMTKTVVPAVEAKFSGGGSRFERVLIGPSLGGLITTYTALKHPEVFALAASQSGSHWFDNSKDIEMIKAAQGSGLQLYFDVGLYEDEAGMMLDCNRKAYAAAQAAGLRSYYEEFPSTHDWIAWRNRLTKIFRWYFDPNAKL